MNVPQSRIQPPADQLLDHKGVVAAMERLAQKPAVRVEELGRSREGRSVSAIVIGRPDVVADPRPVQEAARQWSLPSPDDEAEATWDSKLPVPVLLLASNYGNEAAQTEALLEVATQLADGSWDELPDTLPSESPRDTPPSDPSLLDSLVVIIVPLLNPDGRERALAAWRTYPMATGLTAYGNYYDVQVAREYLHLIEPESAGLADLVRRWHPMLVWEVHEDSINLGHRFAETCLCPPMSPPDRIGTWVASRPGDNDPRLWQQEVKYGSAIAQVWRSKGYHLLHHPEGRHGWPTAITPGADRQDKHPETRFTRAMSVRGVTTFITESARRPGTQTWEERVEQKVDAGLAILRTAAGDVATLTGIVRDVGRAASSGTPEFFAIPDDQDAAVVDRAVRTLRIHDVHVGRTDSAYVVPKGQPRGATAEILLSLAHGRHQSMVATLGLRVLDSELPPTDDAIEELAIEWSTRTAVPRQSSGTEPLEIDAPWTRESTRGTSTPPASGSTLSPRLALYAGQGVKDFAAEGHLGGVRRLMEHEGIPFVLVEADDVAAGKLHDVDVLLVPKGDAAAIMNGSQPGPLWYGPPWQPEEEPTGLGVAGAAAIRAFVEGGGHYVGVDSGGAVLATRRHLGLVDCDLSAENIGTGLVELAVDAPEDRLFAGISGSWDETGSWRDGFVYAMTDCEVWLAEFGAIILEAGPDVQRLASYSRLLPVPDVNHFVSSLPDGPEERRAAIVRAGCGRGTVTLFAVDPTYRSLSPHSAQLLANAVRSMA